MYFPGIVSGSVPNKPKLSISFLLISIPKLEFCVYLSGIIIVLSQPNCANKLFVIVLFNSSTFFNFDKLPFKIIFLNCFCPFVALTNSNRKSTKSKLFNLLVVSFSKGLKDLLLKSERYLESISLC